MGFGIVEPVDDFDLAAMTARIPAGLDCSRRIRALLDALAKDFQKRNYSFRTWCGRS